MPPHVPSSSASRQYAQAARYYAGAVKAHSDGSNAQIAKYHEAARKHRAVLLLNLQPGRSEFITEAKAFQKWLKKPDVGVALDPEWAMDHGQRPGRAYGHTTGAELDEVARYLSVWSSSTTFRRR